MSNHRRALHPWGAPRAAFDTVEIVEATATKSAGADDGQPVLGLVTMLGSLWKYDAQNGTGEADTWLQGRIGSLWYDIPNDVRLLSEPGGTEIAVSTLKRNVDVGAVEASANAEVLSLQKHCPFHDVRANVYVAGAASNSKDMSLVLEGK